MSITVKDLLKTKAFNILEVMAGKNGLDRTVNKVNVIGSPNNLEYIRTGEFLVTNWYVIEGNSIQLKDLVIKMEDAGVAALGINYEEFIDKLPEEVLKVANQLDFPIISLPSNYNLEEAINLLVEQNKEELIIIEEIYEVLSSLSSETSLQKIVNKLRIILNRNITFYNALSDKMYIGALSNEFKEDMYSLSLKEIMTKYECQPIKAENKLYGYIIKPKTRNENQITKYDKLILEYAKVLLKFNIQREFSNYLQIRSQDDFIQDLLLNNISSKEEIDKKADIYELRIKSEIAVMDININEQNNEYFDKNKKKFENMKDRILFVAERIIENYFDNCSISLAFDYNIVFIIQPCWKSNTCCEKRNFSEQLEDAANKISESIQKNNNIDINIGIGGIKASIMDIHKSYNEAQEALEIARIIYKDKKVILYDNLGTYKLLYNIYENNDVQEFYAPYLKKLIIYDKENDTDLLQNLECLVKNGWNLKATSEELFIHYNTMKYRFKQINEILGVDLRDPEEQFNIAFALKLLKLDAS